MLVVVPAPPAVADCTATERACAQGVRDGAGADAGADARVEIAIFIA